MTFYSQQNGSTHVFQFKISSTLSVCIFCAATILLFWLIYDSNLVCFRAADEGVWLDLTIDQSEHGLLPLQAIKIFGDWPCLFQARILSLVFVWFAFLILGHSILNLHGSSNASLSLLPISLFSVWLHPQLLSCSSRASGGCISIFALSICIWGLNRLHLRFGHRPAAIVIAGIGMLNLSTPYGWSLSAALLIGFLIFLKSSKSKNLIFVVIPGLLSTSLIFLFESSRFAPINVFENYFSYRLCQGVIDFGLAANARVLPLEFGPKSFFLAVSVGVFAFVFYILGSRWTTRNAKSHAAAILLFLLIQFIVEYFGNVSTIHYYLMSPFVFLVLTLPLISSTTAKAFKMAILLIALISTPSLFLHLSNSKQKALQEAANLVNQSRSEGADVFFCGTILYHALYPWLDDDSRQNAKVCYTGTGFQYDKYFAGNSIEPTRRIESDHLILGKSIHAIVVNSDFGQGLRVDIPSSWNTSISQFHYGDLEFDSLYLSIAKLHPD